MHRRLAALESRENIGAPNVEIWIDEGDRYVHRPTNRMMTSDDFKAAFPNAERITLNIFEKGSTETRCVLVNQGGNP
jgi:hypothetical protein